jgi:hypothetical protein
MPPKAKTGAVKQHLKHCQLCGFEVEDPCDTRSRLKNCERQIKNKLHGGISSDYVRAVTRGGKVLTYVAVSSAELKVLTK